MPEEMRGTLAQAFSNIPGGDYQGGAEMKKTLAAVAIILLSLLILPYFLLTGETEELDADVRSSIPGQYVALSYGVVHYEIAGPPDGQTVALIHGFSVPYYIWDPTFEALTKAGFRVLRYDLYGRGYSDRPKVAYNSDLFDRQLLDLLNTLDIHEPVDVVGLSWGGLIAAVFTARHPERVRKLCLIDPGPTGPIEPSFTDRLLIAPLVGDYLMNVFGDSRLLSSQVEDFHNPEKMPPDYLGRYRMQMKYKGFKRALLSTLRNVPGNIPEIYKRAGEQGRPMLLIWGREDRTVPFAESEKLRELMPGIEFHAIEDAGHLPHIEQPEVVNRLLIDFLRK